MEKIGLFSVNYTNYLDGLAEDGQIIFAAHKIFHVFWVRSNIPKINVNKHPQARRGFPWEIWE